MPLRRFCSACDEEITNNTLFFEVMITPKMGIDARDEGSNYYNEYCQACTANGQGLINLWNERKNDAEEKGE